MIALVGMVHIIIASLTFLDIDASHKYHDFSGAQGWCLVGLKVVLFLYFLWCYCEAKGMSKKRKD